MICGQCSTALDSRSTFCPTCGATVPDPHVGAEIARRYIADRRIAIGGFGSVYRGRELGSERAVALKIMHRELAGDASLVARFRREGLVLRGLSDPHTVATYEHGQTGDGLPYIAMELLEGQTLFDAVRAHGPLPWRQVFALGRDVCSALDEAHRLGIVHRDLKPANIFLTDAGGVKVLDFGIAKILSSSELGDPRELTIMGTAVGTVEYMAPEQLMGGKSDPRTDLYTLGVVMYESITGRRPYDARGLELLTAQLGEPPTAPSLHAGLPEAVDRVLLRCLAADVDERFASAADLAQALDAAIAAHPPAVAPPPAATPPVAPQPVVARPAHHVRRPALMHWLLVTVAALALGVVAAVVLAR